MDLATHQRKLLGLFRNTYQVRDDDDAYVRKVAESQHLEEGRRNILLWRIFVLERTCPLTVRLLRRRNLLEPILSAFMARTNLSPFRETQGPAFLKALSKHDGRLVASVAEFELALMRARQGDQESYALLWDVDPFVILNSLAQDIPFPDHETRKGVYQILISQHVPGHFQIVAPCEGDVSSASTIEGQPTLRAEES